MKVWVFYRRMDGLNPLLYGYTIDKHRADQINEIRNLVEIEKNVTREEYREWHDKHQRYEFIPFRLKSKCGSTIVLCTGYEIDKILFHGEEIIYDELAKFIVPPEIFSPEIQKHLKRVGFFDVWDYVLMKETIGYHYFEGVEEESLGHIKVDQLGLFLYLYKDTFK